MSDDFQNVTPLHSDPATLRPLAKSLLENARWAGDFSPALKTEYLIKGWLSRGTLAVIYGPSNVGKSFLVLDMLHHVTKGEQWSGRRVAQGKGLYIAAEGGASVANRIAALDGPEFWVLTEPMTLTGKDSAAQPLQELIRHLSSLHGRFDLIVIDTLARVMGAGDENTAPDIADLLKNLDMVRRTTGAAIVLVHHAGKDVARGARGHSSLRAAIDTEIELSRDDWGVVTAEVTKQRDGPTGYKFAYTLQQVTLGFDQDGDQVTTCLVEPAKEAHLLGALSAQAQRILEILKQLIASRDDEGDARGPSVSLTEWRSACIDAGFLSHSEKTDSHRKAFDREHKSLLSSGSVIISDGRAWVMGQ